MPVVLAEHVRKAKLMPDLRVARIDIYENPTCVAGTEVASFDETHGVPHEADVSVVSRVELTSVQKLDVAPGVLETDRPVPQRP
jgi:hypothetical protein